MHVLIQMENYLGQIRHVKGDNMKNIKIVAALIVFAAFLISVVFSINAVFAQGQDINGSILNMKVVIPNIQYEESINDNESIYILDTNYFIKVSGAPTYTFQSREIIYSTINTNQLHNVNPTIISSIKNRAKEKWNWTLEDSKILFQPFERGDLIDFGKWNYEVLASNFTTSSSTAVNVPTMSFTPEPNKKYEFEANLMINTSLAIVNPLIGLKWPEGYISGQASIYESQTVASELMAFGQPPTPLLITAGGLPIGNQTWPAKVSGTIETGPNPTNKINIQLASELQGIDVTMIKGSFLKYREYR